MNVISAIVGLGNPGDQYAETRHNIGWMVTDEILNKFRGKWRTGKGKFIYAPVKIGGIDIYILRLRTFMNNSGIGVLDAVQKLNLNPNEILVVVDDFIIPFAMLRIRKSGSDGGHNGLASIIYHINTENIPRIRIGIGPLPDGESSVDFVLGEFSKNELEEIPNIIKNASEAAIMSVTRGLDRAMDIFNRRNTTETE